MKIEFTDTPINPEIKKKVKRQYTKRVSKPRKIILPPDYYQPTPEVNNNKPLSAEALAKRKAAATLFNKSKKAAHEKPKIISNQKVKIPLDINGNILSNIPEKSEDILMKLIEEDHANSSPVPAQTSEPESTTTPETNYIPIDVKLQGRKTKIIQLPDGLRVEIPLGSKRYRLNLNGIRRTIHLDFKTGDFIREGEPKVIASAVPQTLAEYWQNTVLP